MHGTYWHLDSVSSFLVSFLSAFWGSHATLPMPVPAPQKAIWALGMVFLTQVHPPQPVTGFGSLTYLKVFPKVLK